MKLTENDRLIGTGVILAILVNLASNYYSSKWPNSNPIAFYAILGVLFVWIILRLATGVYDAVSQRSQSTRYAVLVYLIDNHGRLLLIHHPYHKRLLPPGSRLKKWELPHDAVARCLRDEAGITINCYSYEFQNHIMPHTMSDTVEQMPRPYAMHLEIRQQRGMVGRHMAFVFICRFIGNPTLVASPEPYRPAWYRLSDIQQLQAADRPFDDVLHMYKEASDKL